MRFLILREGDQVTDRLRLKMKLNGTKFQISVWKELKKIPMGETRTYKEIAIALGNPTAARAVANACGKNPYPEIIPCHRVIRSDGGLGGYSGNGGINKKKDLLQKEMLSLKSVRD